MTAWKQLSLWHTYAKEWCEHKPSVTISVKEDEWVNTALGYMKILMILVVLVFLPFSDHTYKQAPYQDCTEEEYKELLNKMPKNVDWASYQIMKHKIILVRVKSLHVLQRKDVK